jgi:hypothetical protein
MALLLGFVLVKRWDGDSKAGEERREVCRPYYSSSSSRSCS